ncbi:Cellular retinoic acid-binding protein 1 [Merluccius polli]|uniref:Cellular retinoic acid-binding protein 1 n=1 Tax=Merluccius polli TaxID=89951 RepID=A0AA47NNV7_MERPO|nr:Cellular retinoic acid-binding protein 1 [Merluccius polli]
MATYLRTKTFVHAVTEMQELDLTTRGCMYTPNEILRREAAVVLGTLSGPLVLLAVRVWPPDQLLRDRASETGPRRPGLGDRASETGPRRPGLRGRAKGPLIFSWCFQQYRTSSADMPNFAGIWKMRSSENFDELLKALGVNAMLRKVAGAAAAKPHVEIRQDGEQFYIKTSTTVRTTEINFTIGEEFHEETVDGRKCKSLPVWETENKIQCKQTLVDGEGPKTYWTRELNGDELVLVSADPRRRGPHDSPAPPGPPTHRSESRAPPGRTNRVCERVQYRETGLSLSRPELIRHLRTC